MEQCEQDLRSDYQVHLMVPGKKQQGPISMVAKSYREALPALAWFSDQLVVISGPIRGRIHRNVKDQRIPPLDGLLLPETLSVDATTPYWLFQSPQLCVLAFRLFSEDESTGDSNESATAENSRALTLKTCMDNIVFRLGKEAIGKLDIFMDPYSEYSFAAGDPSQAEVLRREISTAFRQRPGAAQDQGKTDSED